jgi:hypothetical protein
VALTGFILALSVPLPVLRIVPYLMFCGTFLVALSYMIHARLEPRHDTIRARLLVTFLALAQPLVRGWARYFTWLKFKRTPPAVIAAPEENFVPARGSISRLNFWSENGRGREALLPEIISSLESEGWSYSIDTGWKEWDVQIYGSFWWGIQLRSVTEYHGGPKCLTRVHLTIISILAYRQAINPGGDIWLWIPYLVMLAVLLRRAYRLKKRVAALVGAAAQRCNFTRITKKPKPAP